MLCQAPNSGRHGPSMGTPPPIRRSSDDAKRNRPTCKIFWATLNSEETYTRIRDKKKTFVVRLVAAEVNGVRVLDITVVSTLYDYHNRAVLAQPTNVKK